MNIVLLEPEIPQNTGNIARTCAVTGSVLHLIKPLGFTVSDKHLRRSGMDYWYQMDIRFHESFEDFLKNECPESMFFATTKAKNNYSDVLYNADSYIVFGKESAGIPESLLISHRPQCVRIPMLSQFRSINLASSAAIILYEALRQNNFPKLCSEGNFRSDTASE